MRSLAPKSSPIHAILQALVSMGVGSVVAGLWLVAVGNLVAGIAVTFARNAVDTVGSDAFFQFFDI
jgi:hypothetical protein